MAAERFINHLNGFNILALSNQHVRQVDTRRPKVRPEAQRSPEQGLGKLRLTHPQKHVAHVRLRYRKLLASNVTTIPICELHSQLVLFESTFIIADRCVKLG